MYNWQEKNEIEESLRFYYIAIGKSFKGDYPKALEYFEKTLKIEQKLQGKEHPNIASSYNNIGHVYERMSKYPKALKYHEKSLKIR